MIQKVLKYTFLTIIAVIFIVIPAAAADWSALDRVDYVGTMILKRNSLPPTIKFEATDVTSSNRYAIAANTIQFNVYDIKNTNNDNELAYVLSYELGKVLVKNISPNEKIYCDEDVNAMSIDLMINSGYNPLAGISVLEKENKNNQAEYIYNYIAYNYPSKILTGYESEGYKLFLSHFEPVLKQIKNNKRKYAKYKNEQAKISKARIKRLSKYDPNISKLTSWGVTKELIQSITEPEER